MGMITSVAPGMTVQVTMQAVNGNAQSVAGEPVAFTIPVTPVTSAPAVAQPELLSYAAVAPGTDGNGKTNGNGSRIPARVS